MCEFNYYEYIQNLSENNVIIIITGNWDGGSYKWIKDLNIINKENVHLIKKRQVFVDTVNVSYNSGKNIVVILQSFLNTNIGTHYLFKLKKKTKFKMILPIHDWYWINPPYRKDHLENIHSFYLNQKKENIQEITKKIFNESERVICPTYFVYDVLKKLFPYLNNIYISNWIDIKKNKKKIQNNYISNNVINMGVLTNFIEYKGRESINYLRQNIKSYKGYKIYYSIVDHTINRYEDNYESFLDIIRRNNINGLLFLNKWGETWCYSLTKALNSELPIFYNNIGSFKERIPKDNEKYMININNETEYNDFDKLKNNFEKFLDYIIKIKSVCNINESF